MADDKLDYAELLAKSTVKEDLPTSVTGNFNSEEEAQVLLGITRLFGSISDLSALDGITIADDYPAALAGLDRGYPNIKAPIPTSDQFGSGFALAVPVLRHGAHKSHVVLDSALVRPLVNQANEFYKLALHTLAHELAHVYDHSLRVKAMSDHYGTTMTDLREAVFTQFAMGGWDEYAASRLSADWGTPDYAVCYEESLLQMMSSMLSRSEAAKKNFDQQRDVNQTMNSLRDVYETFFIRTSYLLGHIDGIGKTLEEEAPKLSEELKNTTWLKGLLTRYWDLLRQLFDKIESWEGVTEYGPLKSLDEELLMAGGLGFVQLPSGSYFIGFNATKTL